MKAMIMAAGVGSRLMPLTMNIPKPMIPVANKPLMDIIIELLKRHEINDLISNLHYHSRMISDYFGDGSEFGVNLQYSLEEELMGTAGGVKNCEWFLDETFVVISGDALTDIDLTQLVATHRKNGALATIALKEVDDVEHFGIVITDDYGKIQKFQEKPRPQEALSKRANTGIYIFEPEIFKYIPVRQFYDFGKQVFPHLVKIGAPFYGVPISDYWCDIGNIDTYRQANIDILQEKVKVKKYGRTKRLPGANILLGKNTVIEEKAEVKGHVVIGSGCRIDSNAIIRDCVIWNNTVVSPKAVLDRCILGNNCHAGNSTIINMGAVIASGCILNDNIEIAPSMKVFNTNLEETKLEQG